MTACIVDVATMLAGKGFGETRVYDNSWSEYGLIEEPKLD